MTAGPRADPARRAARPRPRSPLAARAGLWGLVAALAGFNGWWLWRETRPRPDAKTIGTWMGSGRFDLAEPALRDLLRRSPDDGASRVMLARALAARGDLLGCVAELRKVPAWWPTKSEALLREGNAALAADRAKDAEAAWLSLVNADPLHAPPPDVLHDAALELMKLYSTEDRWEDAYPVLWRAYDESTPDDRLTLLTYRMRSELERVAPAEAAPLLRKYLAADPTDHEARRALARALHSPEVGRRDEARALIDACLKDRPDDPRVWRDYLAMISESGDRDALRAAVDRAPKSAQAEPEYWKCRGDVKEKSGDLAGAGDDYRRAAERNPNVIEYHYRLAQVEERLGRRAEAAEARENAKRLRDARAQLPTVYAEYFEVAKREPGRPALAAPIAKLVATCRTLGMLRAADGWTRVADSLELEQVLPPSAKGPAAGNP